LSLSCSIGRFRVQRNPKVAWCISAEGGFVGRVAAPL
jgi:hypothetical protein